MTAEMERLELAFAKFLLHVDKLPPKQALEELDKLRATLKAFIP